jgi:hypothetical protein
LATWVRCPIGPVRIGVSSWQEGGCHGVDLVFRSKSGYAIVEAKAGAGLGRLKTCTGLRQGSVEYNISRLQRYLDHSNNHANDDLARTLLDEAGSGRLESFGTFYRGGLAVYELLIGWPLVPAIRR